MLSAIGCNAYLLHGGDLDVHPFPRCRIEPFEVARPLCQFEPALGHGHQQIVVSAIARLPQQTQALRRAFTVGRDRATKNVLGLIVATTGRRGDDHDLPTGARQAISEARCHTYFRYKLVSPIYIGRRPMSEQDDASPGGSSCTEVKRFDTPS